MGKVILPTTLRKPDNYGQGHFGASRGSRTHKGVDYACDVGSEVLSHVSGVVTKLGYPYANHLEYRYVEVTSNGMRHRFFYVEPLVDKGQHISDGDVLGVSQELGLIYPNGITEHIHYEIICEDRTYMNPEDYFG